MAWTEHVTGENCLVVTNRADIPRVTENRLNRVGETLEVLYY